MSEGNGNGNHGGLAALLSSDDENDIEIQLMNPSGEYSGVSFYFKGGPLDAQTDKSYSHILQRNTRQKKSTYDEANRYVFNRRFTRTSGIDDESMKKVGFSDEQIATFKADEKAFMLKSDKMWPLVRRTVVQYLEAVMPDAEETKRSVA